MNESWQQPKPPHLSKSPLHRRKKNDGSDTNSTSLHKTRTPSTSSNLLGSFSQDDPALSNEDLYPRMVTGAYYGVDAVQPLFGRPIGLAESSPPTPTEPDPSMFQEVMSIGSFSLNKGRSEMGNSTAQGPPASQMVQSGTSEMNDVSVSDGKSERPPRRYKNGRSISTRVHYGDLHMPEKLKRPSSMSSEYSYEVLPAMHSGWLNSNECKRALEGIAGARLSWWPLADAVPNVAYNHVRVHSAPCECATFYDDVPLELAIVLFSELRPYLVRLSQEPSSLAIYLRGITLMQVLDCVSPHRESGVRPSWKLPRSKPSHDAFIGTFLEDRSPINEAATVDSAVSSTRLSNPHRTTMLLARGVDPSSMQNIGAKQDASNGRKTLAKLSRMDVDVNPSKPEVKPVLYLSTKANSNEIIARAVELGQDDKTSFQNLRATYRKFPRQWFKIKKITGIRFYRFDSFLYKQALDIHHIELHKDKERYPMAGEPEFSDYEYRPQPWPDSRPFPNNEVWHYLNHPEDCGTSSGTMGSLPVRIKGPLNSQARAFGMHFEERYSVWAILVPSVLLGLVILVPTGWFVGSWLRSHPSDLQNAVVPITMAVSMLTLVLNMLISLLMFRKNVGEAD